MLFIILYKSHDGTYCVVSGVYDNYEDAKFYIDSKIADDHEEWTADLLFAEGCPLKFTSKSHNYLIFLRKRINSYL